MLGKARSDPCRPEKKKLLRFSVRVSYRIIGWGVGGSVKLGIFGRIRLDKAGQDRTGDRTGQDRCMCRSVCMCR